MKRTHLVRQGIIAACALLFSAGILVLSAAPVSAHSVVASVKAPAGKTIQPNLCIDNPKTHTYYCCNKGYNYKCCNLKTHTDSCCLSTGSGVHNSGCCAYQNGECCPPGSQWTPNSGTYTSKWKNDCGYGGGGCMYNFNDCGYGGGCGYGNVWSDDDWCCAYAYPNATVNHAATSKTVKGTWMQDCGFGYGGGCYSPYGGYTYIYDGDCCYVGYAKPIATAHH